MRRIEIQGLGAGSSGKRSDRWILIVILPLFAAANGLAGGTVTNSSAATTSATEAASRRIVVSVPDRKLALVQDGRVLKIYAVAVGAFESPSPIGAFEVINRVVKPAYYHEGKVIKPGKHNPLGSRWMGLSKKGYGIHGTNDPASIGNAASHGCIRMGKRDVEELFALVRVGDMVEIHGRRDAETEKILGTSAPTGNQALVASSPARPGSPATFLTAVTDQF